MDLKGKGGERKTHQGLEEYPSLSGERVGGEGDEERGAEMDPSDKCAWKKKGNPPLLPTVLTSMCAQSCIHLCVYVQAFFSEDVCVLLHLKRHSGSVNSMHHNRRMCVRL